MSRPAWQRLLRVPHPLVLLSGCILLAAAASYVLPAGEYQRRHDEATGRMVVVAGTYHHVERTPVNPFRAVVALPRGLEDAGSVVFLVFLIGGAFTVVDETGTLGRGVGRLIELLRGRDLLVIPVVSAAFAAGGIVENMHEEIIAFIPALLLLTRSLGFSPIVTVSMSLGAAMVGSAFSPINPFQVEIAQKLAQLPLLSGWLFRTVFLVLALTLWTGATMVYAARTRGPRVQVEAEEGEPLHSTDHVVLGLVAATFVFLVLGITRWGWDFNELSAAFFIMGVLAGLVSGLGLGGTAEAYAKGFRSMGYAALLIGFARAIYVVMQDGHIVDTVVRGLFAPLQHLPLLASALGMVGAQTLIHVPVPSVSGQAVLTMPLLVPLADLLHLSRQVAVLTLQYGAGLCDMITPTDGALLAILGLAGVRFEEWIRFTAPLYLALVLLGAVSIAVAIAIAL